MDQWMTDDQLKADLAPSSSSQPPNRSHNLHPDSRSVDVEIKDPVAARKVQKADREKLRRDRLNEQFLELGSTLDPDRPKNDKATILTDTVQVLKDLTAEVNRLKTECAVLTEEARELTQEKNELREEKASIKTDIDNMNVQYQQRVRVMFPWSAIDPSVVMGPPYSYPVPVPVPPGAIPMHPSLQPYSFFGNQNPGAIHNPCSTFIPYPTPPNPPVEQPSAQQASTSQISRKQESKSKSSSTHQRANNVERCDDSNDVATDLELKMPGSSAQQDSSSGGTKGKQSQRKERSVTENSSSSRYSSSQGLQDSSSNSVGDVPKSKN
ncbi:transcription factor bHLH121-like isoform X2 [Juglans microcarpa x Juglans regia]|uniref:transcription factor bHLH121-like isoform X2 n=1 Tax=Juglans microcarpa x Juglans regia TaxID=2249226 RepID=UPI001B7F6FEE|nr:transcription factor bHLH121-like isoform X2 [Juglans microcarpa x Juglans regia]